MLDQRVYVSLISLDHQFVLQSGCATLYLDQQCMRELLYILSTQSGGCEMESNYGFNLHFPN